MKVLMLGAGAVGGYFGARLAEAGGDVSFLVRPPRAALLRQSGLRIQSRAGDLTLQVKCVVAGEVKPEYDIVMVSAKAYDLPSAIDAIAPAMAGGRAAVLPLLNGMSHLEVLDARFGRERVLGGVAYIGSTLLADGSIRHMNDFHSIAFGPRHASQKAACDALAATAARSKSAFTLVEAIEQAMWDKWVMLATLAGMTSLMRATVGDILATGAGERLMLALLAECEAIAQAEGFATMPATHASYVGMMTRKGSSITASMMRDIEAGGQAEGDHILGALLTRARKHSIPAPVLEVAATHVEAYTARKHREKAS
jgi:2-dehydropantoate 2-reductase